MTIAISAYHQMISSGQFKDIYNEHKVMVFNLALNYLQNIEDAEEVTQDVFVSVFQSHHRFDENSTLKTWIYKIAVNKCLDSIKAKKRKKRFGFIRQLFEETDPSEIIISDFIHPGIITENKELAGYLYKAIEKLPDAQKTAFILANLNGLGNKEIAAVMERGVGSVESLLQRAKHGLRVELEKIYDSYQRK